MSAETPLTPQQQAAIHERDVSIALSAGAGCGKTFVLTQRFLRHLQPGTGSDPLAGLVAITFTDRAAREMRDRIRLVCHGELERCGPDEVEHWQKILRGLDSARISTIHSFCASLLRAHAVDAALDPYFAQLDQAEGDAFLRRAVNESLFDLLTEHDEDASNLVLHYGLDRTREFIRHLVLGRFHADFSHFEGATAESLAADWLDRWHEEFLPRRLRDLVESAAAQQTLRLLREHRSSHAEMQARRSFLLEHLPRVPESNDPQSLLNELRRCAQVQGGGGQSAWENADVYEAVKHALQGLRQAIDRLTDDLPVAESDVEVAAQESLRALRVCRRVIEDYQARKQEAGLLDFDDLLLLTRNLLRDEETVRLRAARSIEVLLVDEFQDTDPVQAEIVRLLCGDKLTRGKLFVVGDAKQSIYRFRRADPNVFAELRNELPKEGRLPLSTNFRSQPAILNFVNRVFAPVMGGDYEPLTPHQDEQLSPTPAVEFLIAAPDPEDPTDVEKETAEQRREREADWLARRICALLQDPTPRIREKDPATGTVRLRAPQLGDVAILFRTLNNVAIYEEALRKYGLHYYLVGSRAFFAQQEVYDLVNLCRFLDDCDDEVSLAGVLRSPFFGLNDDTLFALADGHRAEGVPGRLRAALLTRPPAHLNEDQRIQVEYAAQVLEELRSQKDRLPLAALLHLAVDRTGYDASLLNEHLGRRKLANLNKLLDMARQFDRGGLLTLKDFVVRLRESILEETQEEVAATHPEASNVLRLMTIHQAKGLEFPVVIVADMDWTRRGGSTPAVFHPELGPLFPLPEMHGQQPKHLARMMHADAEQRADDAETVRLFYVAATRAADYLILSAGLNADRKPTSPWLKLLAERFDFQTGQPVAASSPAVLSSACADFETVPAVRVHHQPPELPEFPKPGRASSLSLTRFREAVQGAQPAPLPDTVRRLAPDLKRRRHFSVSELDQVEQEQRGAKNGERGSKVQRPATEPSPGPSARAPTEGWSPGPLRLSRSSAGNPESSAALGTLVHGVLEQVDFQATAMPISLIDRVADAMDESPDESIRTEAQSRLQAVFDSPLRRELADAETCFREIEFLLRWPVHGDDNDVVRLSGTIDCLYRTSAGQWKLLDYKTGAAGDDEGAAIRTRYELQVTLYALATREFLGQLPDVVEIVLLGEAVRRIPLSFNDAVLDDVSRRVDAAVRRLRDAQS